MNTFAHAGHDHTQDIAATISNDASGTIVIGAIVLAFVVFCAVLFWLRRK